MTIFHKRAALILLIQLTTLTIWIGAFSSTPTTLPTRRTYQTKRNVVVYVRPSFKNSVEFELQELRAQLATMKAKSISFRNLTVEKRSELENYVGTIIAKSNSPIPLSTMAKQIMHKSWRLAFSTDESNDYPRDSTLVIRIVDEHRLNYILKFGDRVWGLKSLVAKSTYSVDTSPINPGLISFTYQEIIFDMFGFQSIPIGFFGLLKGRINYIDSVWFDDYFWIERGYRNDKEYWNVYVRDDDE